MGGVRFILNVVRRDLEGREPTATLLNVLRYDLGLSGSATKRARFVSRLDKEGRGNAARARLVCPIGLAGVVGREPAVIAVAVMAQLLSLRTRSC